MASYNELLALIDAYINQNGVQAITGQVLNGVLRAMVDQLGRGYSIMGAADPTTDPGTPDGPETWFASVPGTYTNFDGIQIVDGELALLSYEPSTGFSKNTIYEGFQTVQATIDGNVGTPAVGVSYANGILSFDFHNMKGVTGDPAGFGAVTASVDSNIGTPSVQVQTSGPDTAKAIAFQFHNLKGETGVTSVLATVDNTSGNPQCAVSLNGQQLVLNFTGLKGAQGDTGSSVDYPFTIVNNLTTNDPAQALSAAMGVQLESKVSQLEAEVYVGEYAPIQTEATRNIRPTSGGILVGYNDYTYIAEVSSGDEVRIMAHVRPSDYMRVGFTVEYPVNGSSVSGYFDKGGGSDGASLSFVRTAPATGYIVVSCASDFESIEISKKVTGTVGSATYKSSVVDSAVNEIELVKANAPINYFDKDSDGILRGYYIIDGRYASAGGYAITHTIYVNAGVQYKYPHDFSWLSANYNIAVCDPGGEYVKNITGTYGDGFVTFVPTEDCFVRLNIGRAANIDSFMLCLSGNYPETYVAYSKTIGNDYGLGLRQIGQIQEVVETGFFAVSRSVNIFDKDSSDVENNKYIAVVSGSATLISETGYRVSHVLHFRAGVQYKAPSPSGVSSGYIVAASVDGDGNLTGESFPATIQDGFQYYTLQADKDVRLNIGISSIDTFMVCDATEYPEQYVPYYYEECLNDRYSLNETQKQQVYSIVGRNPLYGKSITLNGDSICYGNGYLGGFGKMIADENGMVYENKAVGGATITSGTRSGSTDRHWICDTIATMNENADYAIFEGGVNDASLYLSSEVALGSLSSGFTSVLDKTTFYGAMEYLCKTALTYFDHAKIGFVIVHKMTQEYVAPNGLFYKAAVECLEKWGIPYVNLNIECPPLAYVDSLKTEYTTSGDGWHPNEAGYRRFYVPKIEAWMKTL